MSLNPEIHERLKAAVQQFWGTRETRLRSKGLRPGTRMPARDRQLRAELK
jgi:hypothetical protein